VGKKKKNPSKKKNGSSGFHSNCQGPVLTRPKTEKEWVEIAWGFFEAARGVEPPENREATESKGNGKKRSFPSYKKLLKKKKIL